MTSRKLSVRKLEDFEAVRKHFRNLTMSTTGKGNTVTQALAQGPLEKTLLLC